ncbi:hypothetical protein [Pseudarthrobacter sp. PvP090]|uniref:hypothetical protein n=1 Tax=Pseudarthrobacter sp. PvP090 TaxID=3156393 RepID=UPI00339943E0
MAGLTLSLVLSACGAQPAKNVTAQSAAPSLSASATASPSTDVPSPEVPAPPAAPAAPVQPALKTFTFADGHISFSYPDSWSVRTQRGPGQEGHPWQPVEAIVSDRTGADLFSVSSGANGIGCSAGPVNRTVFDKAPAPGMREVDGTAPMFGFIVERSGGDDSYFMAVMNPRNLEEGDVSSQCTLLKMGNGAAQNRVIFNQSVYPNPVPGFLSRQAAKSWMATGQYAQLKALMLSLKYS